MFRSGQQPDERRLRELSRRWDVDRAAAAPADDVERSFLSALQRLDEVLAENLADEPRAGFTQRTLARLPDRRPAGPWLVWRPALAGATALVCGLWLGLTATAPDAESALVELATTGFEALPTGTVGGQYVAWLESEGSPQ